MALPSTNLWVHQVANELGESSNDIGVLCRSSKINKWSKWKPIQASEVTLNQALFDGYKWGLSIPVYNSPQELYAAIAGNVDLINYNRPTATCRLDDFRNYCHDTVIPIATYIPNGTITTIKKGGGYVSSFNMLESLGDEYRIGAADIKSIAGYDVLYICVCIKKDSNYYFTSAAEGTEIIWDSNIYLKNMTGDVEMFMCLCNTDYQNVIKSVVSNANERFIPIPSNVDNINPYPVVLSNEVAPGTIPYYIYTIISNNKEYQVVTYNISFKADMEEYRGDSLINIYLSLYAGNPLTDTNAQLIGQRKLADSAIVTKTQSADFAGSITYSYTGTKQLYYAIYESYIMQQSGQMMEDF